MDRKMADGKHSNQKIGKTVKLDDVHWQIVQGLIPFYGNSEPEVIRTIVMMWIHDNIGSDAIQKLENLKAINLGNQDER
jgi:hypothetical protein